MADVNLAQFRNLFIQTSLDYLQKIDEGVRDLQKNPSDVSSMNLMFISAHSLKSQSLLMGYTSLGGTAFSLEKLFRYTSEHKIPLPTSALTAVQLATQAMQEALRRIMRGEAEIDLSAHTRRITLILEAIQS